MRSSEIRELRMYDAKEDRYLYMWDIDSSHGKLNFQASMDLGTKDQGAWLREHKAKALEYFQSVEADPSLRRAPGTTKDTENAA